MGKYKIHRSRYYPKNETLCGRKIKFHNFRVLKSTLREEDVTCGNCLKSLVILNRSRIINSLLADVTKEEV